MGYRSLQEVSSKGLIALHQAGFEEARKKAESKEYIGADEITDASIPLFCDYWKEFILNSCLQYSALLRIEDFLAETDDPKMQCILTNCKVFTVYAFAVLLAESAGVSGDTGFIERKAREIRNVEVSTHHIASLLWKHCEDYLNYLQTLANSPKNANVFQQKMDSVTQLKNVFEEPLLSMKEQVVNFRQLLFSAPVQKTLNTHRDRATLRFFVNVLSVLLIIPALVRLTVSYNKYGTLKFWQSEGAKRFQKMELQLKASRLFDSKTASGELLDVTFLHTKP